MNINLVEDMSIKLDLEIREANGIPCELHREYLKQKKDLVLKSVAQCEQIDEFKSFKHAVEEEKDSLVSEDPDYFAKNDRSFVLHSAPAVTIRKQAKELENKIKTFNTKIKALKLEKESVDKELKTLLEKLENIKGYFELKFDDMMNSLNLKRQIYRKGAMNGNDINKLYQPSNIDKIVKVFVPVDIEISTTSTSSSQESQEMRVFSDTGIHEKVETLLTLFSQCYELFSANRPLFKHEVELLAFRCDQFGSWFPTNFLKQTSLRKFYVLNLQVPDKTALDCGNGG